MSLGKNSNVWLQTAVIVRFSNFTNKTQFHKQLNLTLQAKIHTSGSQISLDRSTRLAGCNKQLLRDTAPRGGIKLIVLLKKTKELPINERKQESQINNQYVLGITYAKENEHNIKSVAKFLPLASLDVDMSQRNSLKNRILYPYNYGGFILQIEMDKSTVENKKKWPHSITKNLKYKDFLNKKKCDESNSKRHITTSGPRSSFLAGVS